MANATKIAKASNVSSPSDDMIVLAALLSARNDWQQAEEVASVLRRLGFIVSPQKMVGTLRRLLAEDSPMFERRPNPWFVGITEYRVTRFGLTQIDNRFPHLWPLIRELRGTGVAAS